MFSGKLPIGLVAAPDKDEVAVDRIVEHVAPNLGYSGLVVGPELRVELHSPVRLQRASMIVSVERKCEKNER